MSIENLGEYGWWRNGKIFGNLRRWSSMGEIWKEWEHVGEEWGSVLGCRGGVGDVGKYGKGVEECMR